MILSADCSFLLCCFHVTSTYTVHRTVISIENLAIAGAGFFSLFRYFCRLEKGIILYRFKLKACTALYLQIFNTQNYILFKISALALFLKYS